MSGTLQATIIKDGASSASNITLDSSGGTTFGGKVLGDYTNATVASRSTFQTSTTNGSTGIYALPNGTSTAASWQAANNADPTNASKILIATNASTDVQLVSGINGTGTYLPLSFYTNGTQQMQLSTAGILTGTAGNLMLVQGTSISTATTSFTGATSGANTNLTASSITGTIQIGQVIAGANIAAGTTITGGSGTSWIISPASTGTVSGTVTVVGAAFTSIPSWAKRITMSISNLTGSGTSVNIIQLGTGATPTYTTTGYLGSGGQFVATTSNSVAFTAGFAISATNAANFIKSGIATLTLVDSTTNTWAYSFAGSVSTGTTANLVGSGYIALSGALTAVQLTTVNGTDTFATGKVNIQYE